MSSAVARRVSLAFQIAVAIGLVAVLGLTVDAALLLGNYRLGQAALDEAALAAAGAVDRSEVNGVMITELRLIDSDAGPSAYTLAQSRLDQMGAGRVALADIVSDGGRVLVRGQVASPTLFLRLFGVSVITFDLVSSAALIGS